MSLVLKKGKWLGILVAILSYSYISYRLLQYNDQLSLAEIPHIQSEKLLLVVALLLLLWCMNICLESKKWQLLLLQVKHVKFLHSLKMVIAGFATGIFTPGKLGEPIGRVMFLKKDNWSKATVLNYLGGMIHNILIATVALPCMLTYNKALAIDLSFSSAIYYLISLLILSITLILLWHNRFWVKKRLLGYKFMQQPIQLFSELKSIRKITLIKAYGYSLMRFIVYGTQLYILLWLFGAKPSYHLTFLIPIYFMLITIAPSFFLADLGIRGSVALFVFSELPLSQINIVLVVFILWILNQAIPALLGSVVILRKNSL